MQTPLLRQMLLAALFAALTAVGAYIRIGEVTLQVFFACLSGMLLGPVWGTAAQGVYVLLGLAGLPVFTSGGGLMYVANPMFGFLLGLIPMAALVGYLTKFPRIHPFLAAIAGLAVLYLVALPYFYFATGQLLRLKELLLTACVGFLPFDLLKLLSASMLGKRLIILLRNDLVF